MKKTIWSLSLFFMMYSSLLYCSWLERWIPSWKSAPEESVEPQQTREMIERRREANVQRIELNRKLRNLPGKEAYNRAALERSESLEHDQLLNELKFSEKLAKQVNTVSKPEQPKKSSLDKLTPLLKNESLNRDAMQKDYHSEHQEFLKDFELEHAKMLSRYPKQKTFAQPLVSKNDGLSNQEATSNMERFLAAVHNPQGKPFSTIKMPTVKPSPVNPVVTSALLDKIEERVPSNQSLEWSWDQWQPKEIIYKNLAREQDAQKRLEREENDIRLRDEAWYERKHANFLKRVNDIRKSKKPIAINSDLEIDSNSSYSDMSGSDSDVRVATAMNADIDKPALTALQLKAHPQPAITRRDLSSSSISWRTDDDSSDSSSINFDIDDTGTNSDSDVRAASSMKTHVQPIVPTAKQQAIRSRKKVTFVDGV